MKVIAGIDSGVNGGICVLYPDKAAFAAPVGSITELYDILSTAKGYADGKAYVLECFVEEVTGYIGGKPQPASRSFVLGKSYGSILGLLVGMEIPFHTVRPQKWQLGLGKIGAGNRRNSAMANAKSVGPLSASMRARQSPLQASPKWQSTTATSPPRASVGTTLSDTRKRGKSRIRSLKNTCRLFSNRAIL